MTAHSIIHLTSHVEPVTVTATATVTIETAARIWIDNLRTRKRSPAKPSSLAVFSSYLKVHILPVIGSMSVEAFGNRQMKDFVSHLAGKGLGPKSIQEISGVVKQIINSLVDAETGNRVHERSWNSDFLDMPLVKAQRQPTVTTKELEEAIVSAFHKGYMLDGVLWALAAGTGARIGELQSLRIGPTETSSYWRRDQASLTIRTSVWRNVEHAPKTEAGHRAIEIADNLNSLLRKFVGARSAKDGNFLFANANGRPTDVSTLREHLDACLPGKGFHSFRRWHTTFLRSKQVPEDLIRFRLGHSSGHSVTNRYSKLSQDVQFRKEWCKKIGLGFALPHPQLTDSGHQHTTEGYGAVGRIKQ